MEALRDSELEVLLEGGEDYDTTCSHKSDIPLSKLLYLLEYPWIEVYINWL
jgi:hypothetical protein